MIRTSRLDRQVQDDLTRSTDFDTQLIKTLATVGTRVRLPQGWVVVKEMTPGDAAYILLHGSVEIRKSGQVRRTLCPGEVFGEIALTDRRLRSASVVASTDITALRLEASTVHALIESNPAFAGRLHSSATSRLASF